MAKYVIDLVFDQRTGAVKLTVDFNDPGMTQLELVDAIRDGEVRDDVLRQVAAVFGDELAERVRAGELDMICLDDHPELRDRQPVAAAHTSEADRVQPTKQRS